MLENESVIGYSKRMESCDGVDVSSGESKAGI
jgi:hypothetical protein